MNGEELRCMYGSTPQSFQNRIEQTVAAQRTAQAEEDRRGMGRRGRRIALAAALVLILLGAMAIAASLPSVKELFGGAYGKRIEEKIDEGAVAYPAQSFQLGDVIYSLDEVVAMEDGLLGVGHMTPANDSVVLVAEDYLPDDAAGYGLHYGEESRAPAGAKTYAQVAAEKNAKLVKVCAVAEAVGVDGGDILELASAGYDFYPQQDGSVQFMFELPAGIAVEQGTTYAIRLWVSNWEITTEGESVEETYLGEEWTVEMQPKERP